MPSPYDNGHDWSSHYIGKYCLTCGINWKEYTVRGCYAVCKKEVKLEVSKETWRAIAISGIICLLAISVMFKFGGAYETENLEKRIRDAEIQIGKNQAEISRVESEKLENELLSYSTENITEGGRDYSVELDELKWQMEILRNQVNNEWVYGKVRKKVDISRNLL